MAEIYIVAFEEGSVWTAADGYEYSTFPAALAAAKDEAMDWDHRAGVFQLVATQVPEHKEPL